MKNFIRGRETIEQAAFDTYLTKILTKGAYEMKRLSLAILLVIAVVIAAVGLPQTAPVAAQDDQIVIYMQMGGNQGDPSVLARTNGARAAAEALGIELIEQYAGWDPQVMIQHFNEALAASPDGIVIMGHPGEDAFTPLVEEAISQGIIVTSGNNPLPTLQARYQSVGFGYAGADLYEGGYLTGQTMVAAGLEPGDTAVVYDIWHQEGRSVSSQGVFDALTEAGLEVEQLDMSDEVDQEASLAIPILTAYLEANPDLAAIGTQHGNITANLPAVLEAAGKAPGDVILGGIDLGPATVAGIQDGYINVSFDQVLYLQGYIPVLQVWLTKNFLIPGLIVNTGVGTVTPENVGEIAPLIEAGVR
jgi:simple sugar transport system substrate-binding protein